MKVRESLLRIRRLVWPEHNDQVEQSLEMKLEKEPWAR